jgi:hypothetical protein
VVLATALWYFGTLSSLNLSSNRPSAEAELRQTISERIRGWRQIKLVLNPGRLVEEVRSEHPELAELKLYTTLGSRQLQVQARYRQAQALLVDGQGSVLGAIDAEGVVYPEDGVEVDLPRIEEATALSPSLGQPFIAEKVLDFIRRAEAALAAASLPFAEHRWRLVTASREVQLVSTQPYIVKLSVDRSGQDQIHELKEVSEFLADDRRVPTSYIDLRVDDTAYYR